MKTEIVIKKKLFGGYKVYFSADCSFKSEAESIELSILQMMSQIKSFDFEQAEIDEENCVADKDEENCHENKIGFVTDLVGYDDGVEPFEDEYDEEEEDEEDGS